jgi:hypothetical protein
MEELLQRLVENELLDDETRKELLEAFNTQKDEAIKAAVTEAVKEAEENVRVELSEKYAEDKALMVEAIDTQVQQLLAEELGELKDDIDNFRDLEVEYNKNLVEARQELSQVLKGDMEELVEALDVFLDQVIEEQFEELKEDIADVREIQFGAEVFEAFAGMFSRRFISENGLQNEIDEREQRLADLEEQLEQTERKLNETTRDKKMTEILSSLHGKHKDVMEALLRTTPTEKLEEAYERYIPKILHESASEVESEKETAKAQVLAEGAGDKKTITEGTVVATGDTSKKTEEVISEGADTDKLQQTLERMRGLIR